MGGEGGRTAVSGRRREDSFEWEEEGGKTAVCGRRERGRL